MPSCWFEAEKAKIKGHVRNKEEQNRRPARIWNTKIKGDVSFPAQKGVVLDEKPMAKNIANQSTEISEEEDNNNKKTKTKKTSHIKNKQL